MENTLGTPPLARSHYPKRQDGHEPITYPTNPEVAVRQVPVFLLRFVVGILLWVVAKLRDFPPV